MKKFTLPDWTKSLTNSAILRSKDIAPIFGYKTHLGIAGPISRGHIPPADSKCRRISRYKQLLGWSMGYLRKLEREQ